jgi:ribonuclease P protein component
LSACDKGFDKNLRLKTAGDFDYVFDKPSRSASRCFTILARPNQYPYSRLGLVISKRCAKSAVQRNRLKRLIRESFRQNQEILAGVDVVVLGKTVATTKTNQEITTLLSRQWMELEQRCKNS